MSEQKYNKGFVTLPAEEGKEKEVLQLTEKWGADAIRDSDGTALSPEITEMGFSIYSTLCLVRYDQEWAKQHPEQLVQKFLMSAPRVATSDKLEIDLLQGFFRKKYKINPSRKSLETWQIIDRTTGTIVETTAWEYNDKTQKLTIKQCCPFHKYTVNFLVYQIWDSTSMYNHLTNGWTSDPIISIDPYHSETRKHLLKILDQWLEQHPQTDVVRLTSLFYHFTLDSDQNGKEKYVDGNGYTDCISLKALDDFEKETGIKLTAEDIVDQGHYNAVYQCPSEKYLAWMAFIHKFVITYGAEIVERIHKAGKKAAVYLGDHHIGIEPYSELYRKLNIDIEIGAPGNGVYLRRLADIPGPQIKEARFYPYLFPDIFKAGNDPVQISCDNWVKIRRAILRKCIDRIGYGGYISLALQFPDFLEHISSLCKEFRLILENTQKTPAYTANIKVGILNAWGKLQTWTHNSSIEEKFLSNEYLVLKDGFLECLAGLPVDIQFLSFDDICENGIPADMNVIINAGEAGTAWSGDKNWLRPELLSTLRAWIHNGGGFIGVNAPSAYEFQGEFFQLSDVLGVQKETGKSIYSHPAHVEVKTDHFITQDQKNTADLEMAVSMVYPVDSKVDILAKNKHESILLAANSFGNGKTVYISDLPYNADNSRVLLRAMFWVSNQEDELRTWFSSNPLTECHAFPETDYFIVINNDKQSQKTVVYKENGEEIPMQLKAYESKWFKI